MDLQNIFANGLPDELKNIQEGQIYLFPKFEEGLTEKNIRKSQFINSVSGKLMKTSNVRSKRPMLFVIPTTNQTLWGCCACKVSTPNGFTIEVCDDGSLLEMIYHFYGFDYGNSPKVEIKDKNRNFPPAGYSPERILLDSIESDDRDTDYDWRTTSLELKTTNNKWSESKAKTRLLKALWESELNKKDGVELDYKKILEEFELERNKDYTLKIDIKLQKGISCESDKPRTRDCSFYMVDNDGIEHKIEFEAQHKALYLMFLLFDKGILLEVFRDKDKRVPYEKTYEDIHKKLANNNEVKDYRLFYETVTGIRNAIKERVANITQNKYMEKFCIEGFFMKECYIDIATQEHRDYVLKMFHLQMPEIQE